LSEIKRGRRLPFVVVPYWILDNPQLDTYDLAVYCAIARHADNQGEAYPSRARIAEIAGVNIKTVDRAVEQLQACGALEKRTRKDKAGDPTSNLYIVHELPTGVATSTGLPSDSDGATVGTLAGLPVATLAVHELDALELEPINNKQTSEKLWKTGGLEYARQQLRQPSASPF